MCLHSSAALQLQTHTHTHTHTHRDDGRLHKYLPTTNWSMQCDCPIWSIESSVIEGSSWHQFNKSLGFHFMSFGCGYNQFVSGLAYQYYKNISDFSWWGRCTNYSPKYTTTAGSCWEAELHYGRNGSIMLPDPMIAIHSVEAEISVVWSGAKVWSGTWSYLLCYISVGEWVVSPVFTQPTINYTCMQYVQSRLPLAQLYFIANCCPPPNNMLYANH